MNKMNYNLIAEITILESVQSPKKNGIRSGYIPHHKFVKWDFLLSGAHLYDGDEVHFPGDTVLAHISFPCWNDIKDDICIGDTFKIQELERVVGQGVVVSILDVPC